MRVKLLPNVTPITAGQPAQVRLPVPGPTFDAITLRLGTTKAVPALVDITNIRLVVDGNIIQEYADAQQLDDINQYHGRAATDGNGALATPYQLVIHCRRPEVMEFMNLARVDAERVTSLRTRDVKSAWVEFTVDATWTAPTCDAYSEESPVVTAEGSALITRVKKFTYNPGAAGDFDTMFDVPRGPGNTGIIAIHYKKADVMKVTLKENGFTVIDTAKKEALQKFQKNNGKLPVAGYTVVDFCANGNLNEVLAISPMRDLRSTVNLTAAASFPMYVEYLDRLGSGM